MCSNVCCMAGVRQTALSCHVLTGPFPRDRSLDMYAFNQETGEELVAVLQQLPHLTFSLSVHAYEGTEANRANYPNEEMYEEDAGALPPLAGLRLTALRLIGRVRPPPDLLALAHLRSLTINTLQDHIWQEGDEPPEEGEEAHEPGPFERPWSSLAHLSRLHLDTHDLPGKLPSPWNCGVSHLS